MHPSTTIRVLLVLATLSLAAMFGLWAGEKWPALVDSRSLALILTIAAFLVAGGVLVLSLAATLRFVRCGSKHFTSCAQALWPSLPFLVGGCFLAPGLIGAIDQHRDPDPAAVSPIQINFGQAIGAHDSVFIPFFSVEGRSNKCDPRQSDFGDAQKVSGSGVTRAMEDLMRSLAACNDKLGNTARIDIRGFASSSEFAGCSNHLDNNEAAPTISEHLNWRLAEARRRTVIDTVRRVSQEIIIYPDESSDRWKGPEEMRQNMSFYDRNLDGEYSRQKGALTRRAEIVILSKGSCEPLTKGVPR